MKNHLIALATLGLCGAAPAQSSVTLYGIADAGVGRIRTLSVKDPRAGQNPFIYPDVEGGDARIKLTSHSLMNNVNSRIGLRGVEELGNGARVGFQFETGLDLNDGAADSVPAFWQRFANLWLGGAWGTLKLGRQFTPSLIAQGAYEITGGANYSPLNNSYEAAGLGKRASSALVYTSPSVGGVQAAAAFISKNNRGAGANNIWDIGLTYRSGALAAGLGVNKGADGGATNYHAGARYSFGRFALAASYNSATTDGVPELRRRGFSLGASARSGALTLAADLVRDTKNQWHGRKFTNAVVEARYALSRRTFFYGAALRLDGQTNWGAGLRHDF